MSDHPSPKTTPAMEQWRRSKEQHPDKLVLFRMGDFYELFQEDALKIGRLLGLAVTSRSKGDNAPPMAGVPHTQLDRYVKELLQLGEKVVVVDQLEDAAAAKGVVKRGITRVVTPGTVVEDSILPPRGNNYLVACAVLGARAGLACVDVSTGEFSCSEHTLDEAADELERLAPAEVLLPTGALAPGHPLAEALAGRDLGARTRRDGYHFDPREGQTRLRGRFGVASLAGFGLEDWPAAVGAAGAVLAYLDETQMAPGHLRAPRRRDPGDYLLLDRLTQGNLELVEARGGEKRATLAGVLDHTRTAAGARRLRQWILRPLARLAPLVERQDAVRELLEKPEERRRLAKALEGIADIERIVARAATGRAGARDLAGLARAARRLPEILRLGEGFASPLLRGRAAGLDPLEDIADAVEAMLVDEPPAALREGGLVRPGFNAELDELRSVARGGKDWIARFQAGEQERSGIPSLKVGYNRVFGYYIEIGHAHRDKVPADYQRRQTLANAERYITPALKERESLVLGAEGRIVDLEYGLFAALREQVAGEARRAQAVAAALADLDALASLAAAAEATRSVLPELHEGTELRIVGGRHPVVESLLPAGEFVANDLEFGPGQRVLIVTGPNMAGKSTYIRQAALLVVLAQIGAGVPAEAARVGLCDRIFTRVGAADDLARGQSTFMVEMTETANILNNATPRSFIVLDEVGRGTSTFDGVSLAWAITEWLHHEVKARTLFATHYHELTELGVILPEAKNFNVAVRDWEGDVVFLRKIQPGACDKSYGLQVAKLAGMPGAVLRRAGEILRGLETQAAERDWQMLHDKELLRAAARDVQGDLFAAVDNASAVAKELAHALAGIDPDRLSPRQAHDFLCHWTDKVRQSI